MAAMVKRDSRETKSREEIQGASSSKGSSFTFAHRTDKRRGRGQDVARPDAFSDHQTVVTYPAHRDGAFFTVELPSS